MGLLAGPQNARFGNPKVRIPLPGFLNDAAKLMKFSGQQKRVDELVTAMNRAAEAAGARSEGTAGCGRQRHLGR